MRWIVYGQRGMDSYGPIVEVEADDEDEARKKACPKLKPFADFYVCEPVRERAGKEAGDG